MEVRDDDLGAVDVAEHVVGDEFTALIIAVRIVGLQHAQAVTDRQTGGHDQEPACELLAVRSAHGIDRLPGDDHGHDGRLARARGQLQSQSHQFRVGVVVGVGDVLQKAFPGLLVGGDLRQPDRGLDRLDLAEKRAGAVERMVAPMLQQTRCLRRHAPVGRIRDGAPLVHPQTQGIDDRRRIILLVLCRNAFTFVEHKPRLLGCTLALSGLGNRRDELGWAPAFDNLLRRLPLFVELPMTLGICIRGVQDGLLEEAAVHDLMFQFKSLADGDDAEGRESLMPGLRLIEARRPL